MEEIILRRPTLEDKEEATAYIKEFYDNGFKIHGCGGLDRFLKDSDYEAWLEKLDKDLNGPIDPGRVPSSTFFGIRTSDNRIIGMIDVRHELNEWLAIHGGHIGYGVRPTEHGKHYATKMTELALRYCSDDLNLDKVLLTCDKSNPASAHVIINNGGVLENEIIEEDGNVLQRYWINIPEVLNKNKHVI